MTRRAPQTGKDRGLARNDAVPHDKASRDQEWLLRPGDLRAEIEHYPQSEWPHVVVKLTDREREALRDRHDHHR
jgi:hypothetical protein